MRCRPSLGFGCWLLLILSGLASWQTQATPMTTVRVCENESDYPPFRWITRNSKNQRILHGYSYALLDRISKGSAWYFDVVTEPLSRCLREVKDGHFDMVLNGSVSPERNRDYLLTLPLRYSHFHAFYSTQYYPHGAPVTTRSGLSAFRICGIRGANFDMFGLPAGSIDMGAANIAIALEKLRRGRCDIFPYNIEVLSGYKLLGQDYLAGGDIAHAELSDMEHGEFAALISRHYAHGPQLQSYLNSALQKLWQDGAMDAFWDSAEPADWSRILPGQRD